MIRSLLFSTLYPNRVSPNHGIFVETRLRQLLSDGEVEARVVAPVPWFPFRHRIFGEYHRYAAVPPVEVRNGIQISHPRYLLLPKIGMNNAPRSLARTGLKAAIQVITEGFEFDLIDAHYFYPDGVAASIIGEALAKPVVITGRGTDINLITRYSKPRKMILDAARSCAAIITVSSALKQSLVNLGVEPNKVTVLRNGVDLSLFFPEDHLEARKALRLTGFVIASVGNLVTSKGHDLVIRAIASMPDCTLLVVGRGVEEKRLRGLAASLAVQDRVQFLGVLPQSSLRKVYSAADCLVLASAREGWPNVLLESMACGTPVVASRVGGVPDIVNSEDAGIMLDDRSSRGVIRAIAFLRSAGLSRKATRAHAEQFKWDATTEGQVRLFSEVLAVEKEK